MLSIKGSLLGHRTKWRSMESISGAHMGGGLHVYPPTFVVSPLPSCSHCYNCPALSPYVWLTPVCHPAFHSGLIFPNKPSSGPFLSRYGWHSRDCLPCGDRNFVFSLSLTTPQSQHRTCQEQTQEVLVILRWASWPWSTCSIGFSSPTKPSVAPMSQIHSKPLSLQSELFHHLLSRSPVWSPAPTLASLLNLRILVFCCRVLGCFVIHPSWVCF